MKEELITAREAAGRLGVSRAWIIKLCQSGRIAGARKLGHMWVIPAGAEIAPPPLPPRPKKPGRRIPSV